MTTKYYISTSIENNQYLGKVFLTGSNQLVYTSKPYGTKEQATAAARTFVITSAPPTTDPKPPETITSTATYSTPRPIHGLSAPGRCCGR